MSRKPGNKPLTEAGLRGKLRREAEKANNDMERQLEDISKGKPKASAAKKPAQVKQARAVAEHNVQHQEISLAMALRFLLEYIRKFNNGSSPKMPEPIETAGEYDEFKRYMPLDEKYRKKNPYNSDGVTASQKTRTRNSNSGRRTVDVISRLRDGAEENTVVIDIGEEAGKRREHKPRSSYSTSGYGGWSGGFSTANFGFDARDTASVDKYNVDQMRKIASDFYTPPPTHNPPPRPMKKRENTRKSAAKKLMEK